MIARMKKTLAVAFAIACMFAVRFNGVPGSIVSQSARPVRTVAEEKIAPITSASDQPTAEELTAAARDRGVETHVLQPGEDVAEIARAASAVALGIAGGDGSLAAVADVAMAR